MGESRCLSPEFLHLCLSPVPGSYELSHFFPWKYAYREVRFVYQAFITCLCYSVGEIKDRSSHRCHRISTNRFVME